MLSLNIKGKGKRESKDVGQSNTIKFNSKFSNLYIVTKNNRNFEYIVTKITEIYKNYCLNSLSQ